MERSRCSFSILIPYAQPGPVCGTSVGASPSLSPTLPKSSTSPLRTRRAQPDPACGAFGGGPFPTRPPTRRGLHPEAIHSVVWVDDIVYITKTPPHPLCKGLRGGCPICFRAARTACQSQHFWHNLAAALGLDLSDDKRRLQSQRVIYTGMVVDSFLGNISIPQDKTQESSPGRVPRGLYLPSRVASLRGRRIQHYSAGLPYVLPFVALFSSIIGTDQEPVYESTVSLPPAASEAAVYIRGVLEDYSESGRPLWPPVPRSLYDAFLGGHTSRHHHLGFFRPLLGHVLPLVGKS
jgi:hypothetical protein